MKEKTAKSAALVTMVIALAVFLQGCKEPVPKADDSLATSEGVASVVNASNQFAFDLYSEYKSEEGNIFFSPYSISTALAMTYEGARGQTAEEMQKVFYFPTDNNLRRPAFAKIYNEINKKDKEYQLSTANALWAQKDYQFLDEYFTTTEKYYGGKATNLDFKQDPEGSRVTINDWVEGQTNDKIKELLPKDPPVITPETRLVLTNAIYFKGTWVLQFDKSETREADFKVTPEKTVKAQMMALTGEKAKFNYAETEDLQILEMPYEGEDLSMLILLPKQNSLEAVESGLSVEKLNNLRKGLVETKINVHMPKFKFETKYLMKEDLKRMGMPTAFSMDADFSGMTGTTMLYIGQVIHQAFVEVDEKGTEAAAATAVIMLEKSAAMSEFFIADHPFIFIIQERETGNILFLGRVVDPTK